MSKSPLLEFLDRLELSGMMKEAKQFNILVPSVLTYREIFQMVDAEMMMGNSKTVAVTHVTERLGYKAESTVWRALKELGC